MPVLHDKCDKDSRGDFMPASLHWLTELFIERYWPAAGVIGMFYQSSSHSLNFKVYVQLNKTGGGKPPSK